MPRRPAVRTRMHWVVAEGIASAASSVQPPTKTLRASKSRHSAGVPYDLVPVSSLDALARATPSLDAFEKAFGDSGGSRPDTRIDRLRRYPLAPHRRLAAEDARIAEDLLADPARRRAPTGYYGASSGVGIALATAAADARVVAGQHAVRVAHLRAEQVAAVAADEVEVARRTDHVRRQEDEQIGLYPLVDVAR